MCELMSTRLNHCSVRLEQISAKRLTALLAASCVVGLIAAGCQLSTPRFEKNPLSYSQQEDAILEIVPKETDRDVVVEKLARSGIQGNFSPVSKAIYYCDTWEREDGKRWLMDVALLFDESGKFYATRNSQAQTGIYHENQSSSGNEN